jgi:hypothetical protein
LWGANGPALSMTREPKWYSSTDKPPEAIRYGGVWEVEHEDGTYHLMDMLTDLNVCYYADPYWHKGQRVVRYRKVR